MSSQDPLLPSQGTVPLVTSGTQTADRSTGSVATRDHTLSRRWAAQHDAEPATGEATASGPSASMSVRDGGAGIRFNFPGVGRFRGISWEEWLEHFDLHELVFVYEEPEQQGQSTSAHYRIVRGEEWKGLITAK